MNKKVWYVVYLIDKFTMIHFFTCVIQIDNQVIGVPHLKK